MTNQAPIVTTKNVSVGANLPISGSSLIASVTDQDRDPISYFRVWDSGTGGGHFTLGGVAQAAGQWIVVAANNLAALQYVGGAAAGSETLYVEAWDGKAWSAASSLTATTS